MHLRMMRIPISGTRIASDQHKGNLGAAKEVILQSEYQTFSKIQAGHPYLILL